MIRAVRYVWGRFWQARARRARAAAARFEARAEEIFRRLGLM